MHASFLFALAELKRGFPWDFLRGGTHRDASYFWWFTALCTAVGFSSAVGWFLSGRIFFGRVLFCLVRCDSALCYQTAASAVPLIFAGFGSVAGWGAGFF